MKKVRLDIWAGVTLLAVGILLLLWKAPRGSAYMDECFYLSLAKRFAQGDRLLIDEWFISQPFGFLLIPLMKFYMLVSGKTEGIILTFRYFYVALHLLATAYLIWRMWKKYQAKALYASFLFLVYVPFNIMSFSYNNMGITFLLMAGVTLVTIEAETKGKVLWQILAGVFFAASVLCCPYLLAVYILYVLGVVIYAVKKKNGRSVKALLFFTLGAGTLALLVLISIVTSPNFSMENLKTCLAYVFTNPTHDPIGIWSIRVYFQSIYHTMPLVVAGILFVVSVVTLKVIVKEKGKYPALIIALIYSTYLYFVMKKHVNFCVMPLAYLGIVAFLFTKKKDWKLFGFIYLPSVLYTFCISLSSNQKDYNIASVLVIASFASILFLLQLFAETKEEKTFCRALCGAAVLVGIATCVCTTVYYRATVSFWEVAPLTTRIEEGVQKGLKVPTERAEEITAREADATFMRTIPGESVCYIDEKHSAELFLADDRRNGSFTSYYEGDEGYLAAMLSAYYVLFPEKKADVLWLSSEMTPDFWKMAMQLEDYECVTAPCGATVFYR